MSDRWLWVLTDAGKNWYYNGSTVVNSTQPDKHISSESIAYLESRRYRKLCSKRTGIALCCSLLCKTPLQCQLFFIQQLSFVEISYILLEAPWPCRLGDIFRSYMGFPFKKAFTKVFNKLSSWVSNEATLIKSKQTEKDTVIPSVLSSESE